MRRAVLLLIVLAAVAVATWSGLRDAPPAQALVPADIVGVYRVNVKGFAATQSLLNGTSTPRYRDSKIRERGLLVISLPDTDDGSPRVNVQLTFDKAPTSGSTLDVVSPDPPIRGSGFLVGDSLSVIDAGSREFSNTLVVQFLKRGKKLSGAWVSAFHGWDSDLVTDERQRQFTSRLHAQVVGKRLRVKAAALAASRLQQSQR